MLPNVFARLNIRERSLLPIVQGGMGIGISAQRLAGTVARLGAVGTVASVDLRRHHPDLMERTGLSRDRKLIEAANLEALDREVKGALRLAEGCGMVAVNVMRAVNQYPQLVRQACESGAHAVVVGAGLPLDLPSLTARFPEVALVPILSDVRGIELLLKKWMRKGRLPDAIIIENPRYAAGHLGAPDTHSLTAPRFAFPEVLQGARALFARLGIADGAIPLIAAGGIHRHAQVHELMELGAAAIQMGTPFAVTEEGDAHIKFKRTLTEAQPEQIVTFMSAAGLPARAVRTPWLENYLEKEAKLRRIAKPRPCTAGFDCLQQCGWRDGDARAGQFCIDTQLAFAMNGDVKRGLFFRGSEPLPFGPAIRPAHELITYLLSGLRPGLVREPLAA
ncbi:MAG: nitronate monooxygenase family protein [Pseudomonadota bacterium]